MVGAPMLSAMSALRTGAGLVTIASSPEVIDKLEKRVLEIMTLRVSSASDIQNFIKDRKVSVLAIGSGMKPDQAEIVRHVLQSTDLPVVLDGGGLAALDQHFDLLNERIILTPHTGEFQKLINEPIPKQREELKEIARYFSRNQGANLVLKGEPTYVIRPAGSVYVNSTGNPGLATAGTGDVLAGVIAGIIAQGIEPAEAAEAAVYLHGLAGDLAAKDKTEPGLIASDVVNYLPTALATLI